MTYFIQRHRNPVNQAVAMQNAFDSIFNDSFFRPQRYARFADCAGIQPMALDVYEDEDKLVVEATLPGINPDDVDISIQDNVLTIKAETVREEKEEAGATQPTYYLRERRSYNTLKRSVNLPVDVNTDAAEATFNNGVLNLLLPKAEEVKPKRITVKVGQ